MQDRQQYGLIAFARSKRQALPLTGLQKPLVLGLAVVGLCAGSLASANDGASTVKLHALDGSAVINGELIEVSDGSYVIKTAIGTMRIGIEEADCRGSACPGLEGFDGDFSIYGPTDDVGSLLPDLLSSYAEAIGAVYELSETTDGYQQVSIRDEKSDRLLTTVNLATSSSFDRQTNPNGLQVFREDPGLADETAEDELLLAYDGIGVIVHRENPLTDMSRQMIAEVFSCSRTDWRSLGGPSAPIQVYARDKDSSTYQLFNALVLEQFGVALCDQAVSVSSDAELASYVTNDPNAVGFVKLDQPHNAKSLAIRECSLAHEPSAFNVKTGEYPLARRIFLDAPSLANSSAAAQKFVDFTLSDNGQRELQRLGLVDLAIDTPSVDANTYRLTKIEAAALTAQEAVGITRLIDETENATRLSATFRFQSGFSNLTALNALDNRAQRDLTRLARYLQETDGGQSELLVFGFADAAGEYDLNLALSEQRAQSIANKLASLGVTVSVVAGFGEEAPVACNSTASGRAKNRRVEIWLRRSNPDPERWSFRKAPL